MARTSRRNSFEAKTTRSGQSFASTVFVKINVDAGALLLRALRNEDLQTRSSTYLPTSHLTPIHSASPEFSPTASPPSQTPAIAPPPTASTGRLLDGVTAALNVMTREQKKKVKKKLLTKRNRSTLNPKKGNPLHDPRIRSNMGKNFVDIKRAIFVHGFDIATGLTIAKGADVGINRPAATHLPLVESLLNQGFDYVENKGIEPLAVLDKNGKLIFGIFPGPVDRDPNTPSWSGAVSEMCELMESLRSRENNWAVGEQTHRRGPYTFASYGATAGNGRTGPGMLKQRHPSVSAKLRESLAVRRVAGHQDRLFRCWQPGMYRYCLDNIGPLLEHHPELERPFENSIYTTFTANLGPDTVTYEHVDSTNLVQQMCAVTNGGEFDSKKGGHMILYDLKLIIEFPSGCTALIPSSTLRHGNSPIAPGETRYSFTQYIIGSLVRWVRHGFRLAKDLTLEEKADLDGPLEARRDAALAMFTTLDEVVAAREVLS